MRLEQARHLGIEPILVDALVDHIYPASCGPVDEVSISVHFQVFCLGEDGVHLPGVDVVVEVELVVRTTAYDGQRRIRAFGGGGPQSVTQASEPAVERQDGELGHRIGEEDLPAHPAPAGHRGEADRHLGILFDHQVIPALPALYGNDIECYLAHGHGTETVLPARVVEDAALDDLPWDDLLLACFEAAQKYVDGAQALGQTGLETFPVRGPDDAGDPVRWMGLVALRYAEGVLLVEQETVRLAQLPFPPLGACASQLVEDRLVDPTQSSFREEDLVWARECALEPHRLGIILAPGQGTFCRADRPRPVGADSGRKRGHTDS